ncbi:MAG: ABC transporter ATP-binding protein/permease [Lachnospiraceae bacterium]|nr:ABC transporter ATP-binding protein/permease [Lachnospiraceae bacterium]
MKTLLKYFNGLKTECFLGPLFKLLEACFELFVPLVIAGIIDTGIALGNKRYVTEHVMVLGVLAIVGLTCSLTAQYFSAKAATRFATRVRSALFKHIQTLSYTEIDTLGSGSIITRMTSDVNQVQSGVNMTLRLFLRSPFIVFGAMIMAFTVNARISLIFLIIIILLSIVVYGIMIITIPKQRQVQKQLDNVLVRTRDNLSGVRVIRAFRKEKSETEKFNEENGLLTKLQLGAGRISALTNPVTYIIVNIGIVCLIYKGAINVKSGILTQGQVVALVNYMSQILVELIKLANFILLDIKALASASRIEEIFKTKGSMEYGSELLEDENAVSVSFENVSLKYKGAGDYTLRDITFDVKPGQTVGVIGGTGAGKTTLINLITRFYDATEGAVKLNGKEIKSYTEKTLRRHISIVPQKAVLFSGSVRDNMRWGNENATDDEIGEALKIADAYDFVMAKEGGLDYRLTPGGKNLSGGQRQRLTMARALTGRPGVLIMDDSFSALDALTDAKVRGNLSDMKLKPTVFIVSQRTASIMKADLIIVLENGRLAGLGTHDELLKSCEVYKEIYNSQFGDSDE